MQVIEERPDSSHLAGYRCRPVSLMPQPGDIIRKGLLAEVFRSIYLGTKGGDELAQVGAIGKKRIGRAAPYISEVDKESVKSGFHLGVAWTGQLL